jgi:hypothetical protein
MHEPLMVALDHPPRALCSSFIDKVDILTSELVLHSFIICLDPEGVHGDLRGKDSPCTKKKSVSLVARLGEVRLPHSVHGSSSIHF